MATRGRADAAVRRVPPGAARVLRRRPDDPARRPGRTDAVARHTLAELMPFPFRRVHGRRRALGPCRRRNATELVERITRPGPGRAVRTGRGPGGGGGAPRLRGRSTLDGGHAGCARCDAWGPCPEHCAIEVRTRVRRPAPRASSSPRATARPTTGIRSRIDHTLLKPDATREDIDGAVPRGGARTASPRCASIRTGSPLCRELLRDSGVKVCTVIGFPARRPPARGQGLRGTPRRPARAPRDRHGDQHRRAQVQGLRAGRAGHPRPWSRPAGRTPWSR